MRLGRTVLTLVVAGIAAAPAAAEPARPADAFTDAVGVNVHVMFTSTPYRNMPAVRQALRDTGIRQVRDGIRGRAGTGDEWYWRTQVRRLRSLGADGVGLDLILPGPDAPRLGIRKAVRTAGLVDNIVSFEGTNEWDINGPPGRWALQVQRNTREMKAELERSAKFRDTPLVGPAMARSKSLVFVGDLSDVVDYGNGHPYSNGGRPELPEYADQPGLVQGLLQLTVAARGEPIIFTESGYHNALNVRNGQRPVPEDVAAVYMLRTLLEHVRLGVVRSYLYELVDERPDPLKRRQESNWGLYSVGWKPKPAATALGHLMALVRDPEPSPTGASLDYRVTPRGPLLRTLLLARPGGGFTLVLWHADSIWNHERRRPIPAPDIRMTVSLGQQFPVARVFHPMEGTKPIAEMRDVSSLEVQVGAEPVLVDVRQDRTAPVPAR